MQVGSLEIELFANIARLQRDMDAAKQVVSRATDSIARAATVAKNALASIGGGIGLHQIAQLSDEYAKFTAQLRLATQSHREYAQAYDAVKRIAKSSQADLSATGALYAQVSRATQELGVSQKAVGEITEAVNLALKISGAGAQESAGAVLQLSQAFASGSLRGDEFNSVNEAAPRLMKALADSIGVPVGALRAMAAEGKLTSELIAKALPNALGELRTEAAEVQTIAGSFTLLKNNVLEFVGSQTQASGVVSGLVAGVNLLANNLQLLAGAALTAGAAKLGTMFAGWAAEAHKAVAGALALRAATIAKMQAEVASADATVGNLAATKSMIVAAREEAISKLAGANASIAAARAAITAAEAAGAQSFALRTVRLATAELTAAEAQRAAMVAELAILGQQQARVAAQIASATAAQTAAQTALNGATGAGTVAAGLASRAIGFLGGWVGALITILGLAATAWSVWGNKSKDASQQAAESFDETQVRIIKGLDEQIAKNEKLIQLKNAGMSTKDAEKNLGLMAQLSAASQRLNDINTRSGEFASGKSNTDIELARMQTLRSITDLTEKMAKAEQTGAAVTALSVSERVAAFKKEHATKDEQMQAELKAIADLKGKTAEYDEMVRRIREKYADKGVLQELEKEAALMSELSGLSTDFYKDWDRLTALFKKGHLSVDGLTEAQAKLLAKQPAIKSANDAAAKAIEETAKRATEGAEAWARMSKAQQDATAKSIEDAIKEAEANEERARTFGMTKGAIEALELARLEEQLAQRASLGLTLDEIETLEKLIAAKKRNAAALTEIDTQEARKKEIEEWARTSEQIGQSFADNLMKGGKNVAEYLKDLFRTLILRPILQPVGTALAGAVGGVLGLPGVAQAATGATAGTGLLGSLGGAYSMLSGGLTLGGGLGTGLFGSLAGGLNGAGLGSGLTSATGLAIGESIAGVVGPQVAGAISSGLSMAAAAMPWVAGLAAAVAVFKKLDNSGTYHTGGAASASSAGVSAIRAESLNFQPTRISGETEKMVSGLAQGIVGILDSTALAFGKTAGYTAATAFADDTSKDGAWGALVINKLGQKIVDWQDTRTSRWAPKEFADGEAGQKQYLAELSKSVRTALDGIGLPSWAQKMLDGLGENAGLDEMAKVVEAINVTQVALKQMGDRLVGFADLSESAVSALMAAAGGIQNLAAGASAYYENFYSESEKSASVTKHVSETLASIGLAMPATREGFRALVEAQLKLGEVGAPAVAKLFSVAQAFAELHPLVDATTDAIQQQTDAQQAMRDAASSLLGDVDNAFSVLQRVVGREKSVLQERADATSALIARHKALSDALRSTLDSMRLSDQLVTDRAAAQAQVKAALAVAKAGGPLPDAESLRRALGVLSQDSASMFATQQDYLRDFYTTRNDIAALAKYSDDALTVEEKTLEEIQSQVKSLDAMLAREQEQIDVLKGISTTGLSIVKALEGLRTAMLSARANPLVAGGSAISQAYLSALGRAPDAAGLEYWNSQIAGGLPISAVTDAIANSAEAKIQGLYKELLGRPAEAAGLNYWLDAVKGGESFDAIRAAMMRTDEYRRSLLPGFDIGTNFVPMDMPAVIHEGERIIPAADNRELMRRLSSPSENSAALAKAVEQLTREVEGLRAEARATAGHTEKTSRLLTRVVREDKLIIGTEEA